MGRKKIAIQPIVHKKTRQVTFNKRKLGLVKKAIELSVLCEAQVLLLVKHNGQFHQYSSADPGDLCEDFQAYQGPCEVFSNQDVLVLSCQY
jgi:hypothetical protein